MTVIGKTHRKIKITQMFNYLSESEIMKPVFNGINTNNFDPTLQMVLINYMIYYIFFSVTKNTAKKYLFSEKLQKVLEGTESSQNYDELGIEISRLVKEEEQFKPYGNRDQRSNRSGKSIVKKSTGRDPLRAALLSKNFREKIKPNGGSPKTRKNKFRKNKIETHL